MHLPCCWEVSSAPGELLKRRRRWLQRDMEKTQRTVGCCVFTWSEACPASHESQSADKTRISNQKGGHTLSVHFSIWMVAANLVDGFGKVQERGKSIWKVFIPLELVHVLSCNSRQFKCDLLGFYLTNQNKESAPLWRRHFPSVHQQNAKLFLFL